jgi:hypothetical protein
MASAGQFETLTATSFNYLIISLIATLQIYKTFHENKYSDYVTHNYIIFAHTHITHITHIT